MRKIFGNIQYYRILPTIENNYSSTKNSRATFFKAIRLSLNKTRNFPSLPCGRFGFFLRWRTQKPLMGSNIPSETLNKPFKLPPFHGDTPKRGYVWEYELFLNKSNQRVKEKVPQCGGWRGRAMKSTCSLPTCWFCNTKSDWIYPLYILTLQSGHQGKIFPKYRDLYEHGQICIFLLFFHLILKFFLLCHSIFSCAGPKVCFAGLKNCFVGVGHKLHISSNVAWQHK